MNNNDNIDFPQLLLMGIYVSVLTAANAGGSKIIAVGSLAASATVFSYAFSFLVTDVVSEIYGKKTADRFVIIGFFGVLLAVLFFRVAIIAPPASFYKDQKAFESIFNVSTRLLIGGFSAYLISQFVDVRLYHYFKKLTRGRHMWLRNNASTLCSQFIDTTIFITISFYGIFDNLWPIIFGQYLIKIIIALIDTPIIYLVVYIMKKRMKSHELSYSKKI